MQHNTQQQQRIPQEEIGVLQTHSFNTHEQKLKQAHATNFSSSRLKIHHMQQNKIGKVFDSICPHQFKGKF
jgi:hypothetical protein